MNYEVNPFQDYESITIDELKDQANSLLNLVTEEQQPQRVIGVHIGRTRSTAGRHIQLALKRLRRLMEGKRYE